MIIFSIKVNSEDPYDVGIDAHTVTTVNFTYVNVIDPGPSHRENLELSSSALNCDTKRHVNWGGHDLEPGDKVLIEVKGSFDAAGLKHSVPANLAEPFDEYGQMTYEEFINHQVTAIAERKALLQTELEVLLRDETARLEERRRFYEHKNK